ncbi:magnetosome-associated protein MamJ-like [Pectinophora gossypiella]|uniref:magnetosome-associated protein MamJ-like n=1 Tax=Pectinophora gossypiella TaxID=13191 RepID=UPI00214E1548|nr:magnetosome-associated protein MamJ-like [Pectinophora gossypiella]
MKVLAVFVALVALASAAPRSWTLDELTAAIENPATDPALKPYLIEALNQYMDALWNGQQIEAMPVLTPVGIVPSPSEAAVIPPVAVLPEVPVVPGPVLVPVVPEPTPAAAAEASSPLVQIIVNVNAQQQGPGAGAVVTPVEEQVVDPVIVVDDAINTPEPIQVVETPVIPEPVQVIETPVLPEPVQVVDPVIPEPIQVIEPTLPEINPIDVIAIGAPEPNPIDVIAVGAPEPNPIDVIAIGAPEVNPVDLISPVPVGPAVVGAVEGIIV